MQPITIITMISALALLLLLIRVRGDKISKLLILATSLIFAWQLMDLLAQVLTIDEAITLKIFELGFIPLFFINPVLFLVVLEYVAKQNDYKLLKKFIFIFPVLSSISLVTNSFPFRFFSNSGLLNNRSGPMLIFDPGFGYLVHVGIYFVFGLSMLILLSRNFLSSQRIYRRQNYFLLIGTTITVIVSFLILTISIYSDNFNVTAMFKLSTVFMLYFGIFRLTRTMITPIAQELMIEQFENIAIIVNPEGYIIYLNPKARTFYNECIRTEDEPKLNRNYFSRHHIEKLYNFLAFENIEEGHLSVEDTVKVDCNFNEHYFHISITALNDNDDSRLGYVYVLQDYTEKVEAEKKLHRLAYYDELTGLGNKNKFYKKLEKSLRYHTSNDEKCMLLFIDVDNFNVINDSLGYTVGDNLLIEICNRLKSIQKLRHSIYRFSGDVFAVVIDNIENESYNSYIEEMLLLFNQPVIIGSNELSVSISIGACIVPDDGVDSESLVRKANAALHSVKKDHSRNFQFSNKKIEAKNQLELNMQFEMMKALRESEFELYLQPQIKLVDSKFRCLGAEALIRWIRNGDVLYRPDQFISVAEKNGFIVQIGEWVISEIYRINAVLKEKGIDLKLSINVSSNQLNDSNFTKHILSTHENHQYPIDLVIEVTETVLLSNTWDVVNKLNLIKELGIGVALDDFGTGYSSLSYLKNLPIDYLKIDKMFIDDIVDDKRNITAHIISMANTLGMSTIAEGVEDSNQLEKLINSKIDFIQGYHFSKPLNEEDFIEFVETMNEGVYYE